MPLSFLPGAGEVDLNMSQPDLRIFCGSYLGSFLQHSASKDRFQGGMLFESFLS